MSNRRTSLAVILPYWSDPRFVFGTFAIFFIWFSLVTMSFGRTLGDFLICFFAMVSLELIFNYILRREIVFPLSGMISSVGAFLLVDTQSIWIVLLVAFLTIGSKFFIQLRGRHIFNPNNFAIVVVALAFPELVSPTGGMRWGGQLWLAVLIFTFGLILVYRARRWLVSFSYISVFFSLALLFKTMSINNSIYTLLSPGSQLFIFFMISDPRTSPNSQKLQILFGVSIALLDHLFRLNQFRLAGLFSLFLVALLYSLADLSLKDKDLVKSWKVRSVPLGEA
ncbi:MAG: RnfABCDGE type electron transport complex subunit D [Bdellovibrionaceae bacterium]|nr:RnfABCDGE type electron transport complex subunit D [Pseudobdellovibrionaceae bacterium]